MQAYMTLIRRELGSFFHSWIGYVVIAGAMFLMGLSFVALLDKLQMEPTPMPLTEIFMDGCFWFIVLFSAPVIAMRLFALEKFSGTFETLMTTPVSDWQVVLAKFTAAILFYMLMWLPLLGCVLALRYFARVSGHLPVRLPLHGGGLLRLGSDAQPNRRRHDQLRHLPGLFPGGLHGRPDGLAKNLGRPGARCHQRHGPDEGLRPRRGGHPLGCFLFDIQPLLPLPNLAGH
jgi:hypothetical protein